MLAAEQRRADYGAPTTYRTDIMMLARRVDLARNSRLVVAIALACGATAAAPAAAATPEVFPMPSGMNAQEGIATAPDGAVWFAGSLPGAHPARAQLGSSSVLTPEHGERCGRGAV